MDLNSHYTKLLRFCYMKTGNMETAEDITQETFLKFWESNTYKDVGKELPYLYAIARNLCADYYRRPHPEMSYVPLEDIADEEQDEINIDSLALKEVMKMLPDDLKEAVILRYANDYLPSEIGKIMNISRFAVNRKLKKALQLLKSGLEKGGRNDG